MLNSLTLLKINWWFSHTLTLPLPFQGRMSGLIFSGSHHASFSCDDTIWIKMEGLPPSHRFLSLSVSRAYPETMGAMDSPLTPYTIVAVSR